MKQLTISPMYLLVAAFDAKVPAHNAAALVMELLELPELLTELEEAREQAYNGLNADYGDYMKGVQLVVLAKKHSLIEAEAAKQLAEIMEKINELSH